MQTGKKQNQQKWYRNLRSSLSNDYPNKRNFIMTRGEKGINSKAKLAQSHQQLKEYEFKPTVLVSKKASHRVQTVRSHNQLQKNSTIQSGADPNMKLTS